MVQQKQIRLGTMGLQVRSLDFLGGLRIQHCCELWCGSQTWLRSSVAVAMAGSCSSSWTSSLETSICRRCGPKKTKDKRPKKKISIFMYRAGKRKIFYEKRKRILLLVNSYHPLVDPGFKDMGAYVCLWRERGNE